MLDNLKKNQKKNNDSKSGGASSKDTDKDVAQAKQRSMIVKVIIVLALAYLAYDHFLVPENITVQAPPAPTPKPKKKKREESASAEIVNNENAATESASLPAPEEAVTATPEALPMEQNSIPAPTENINVLPSEAAAVGEIKGMGENIPLQEQAQKIDDLINAKIDILDATNPKPEENKLESKIVEESVYVDPPNYEKTGRGLVYNCKGKHWACVEKDAYQVCHKNMTWNNNNGKTSECVTQNVYGSEEDCNVIQKYNISTNVVTDFCKI